MSNSDFTFNTTYFLKLKNGKIITCCKDNEGYFYYKNMTKNTIEKARISNDIIDKCYTEFHIDFQNQTVMLDGEEYSLQQASDLIVFDKNKEI